MRAALPLSALALLLSLSSASAMCGGMGGGQQAQASQGQASQSQGTMMCGRPGQSTQAEDPFGLKQSRPQQQTTGMGMCPCCRGMAMMQGGGMKMDDDPHKGMDHKGMDMSPKP